MQPVRSQHSQRRSAALLASTIASVLVLALGSQPSVRAEFTRTERPIFLRYNVQSTSYIYGFLTKVLQPSVAGRITTSGSSATWTAVGSDTPFSILSVGDRIIAMASGPAPIPGPRLTFSRTVTAKASSISLTAHAVANLQAACGAAGCAWTYMTYTPVPGTAATDGWVGLGAGTHTIGIELAVLDATSVEYSIETRSADGGPIQITTGTFNSTTFPGNGDTITIGEAAVEIRVGLKKTGAGTANAVNVSLFSEQNK